MGNYEDTLAIFKDLQKNGATEANYTMQTPMMSDASVSSDINALDEMVYGKASESLEDKMAGQKILNQTLNEIKTGQVSEETANRIKTNISNSKLDPAIIQSFLENPLINENVGGDDIDTYMQKHIAKNKNILASQQINERLNEQDNKKRAEIAKLNPQPQQTPGVAVDMNQFAQLIESILDKKLNEYCSKMPLNESRQPMPQAGNAKIVQLKENGNFLMVDSEDNVYECTLTYKGKNKRKQK